MGPIIQLLILALFALTTGAASVARQMINYGQPDVVGYANFSNYCTYPMYIAQNGTSEATFDGDCSSKVGGANNPGAQLANSQLNFNDCFMNSDGKFMPSKGLTGDMITGDIFDINDYIGVTWSEEHQNNLLVCASPTGDTVATYQGCTKSGVTRPDPLHKQKCL
ncbi:hypothetical protein INS49_011436 [Diaporthe citri]|uniref:uncharacterized protein n=1 Tax=Diaporthe citri TaxID=83186 RepID=UPI001C825AB6|nr:uncharacterized protein INS49_011436 [Diaporthe citri]KAG6360378.1 hypothetical protein INS49_011436 [Diaporthe citri]